SRSVPLFRRAADRFKPILSVVSRLLILAIILKAAVDVSDRVSAQAGPLAPGAFAVAAALCVGIHVVVLLLGVGSSRVFHFDRPTQIAVAFASSQKTLPVAIYLFEAYFLTSYPLAVVPLVFYHVGQLLVDTLIAEHLAGRHGAGEVDKSAI